MKTHAQMLRIASLAALTLALLSGPGSAGTIFVDDDGPADYATISDAVANAVDGDLIVVAAGTYVEQVIVDVSVSIAGAGVGQTIVMPSVSNPGSGPGSQVTTTTWVFRIQDDNVTLSSFTVDGNNPALSAGIDARGGIITDYSVGPAYSNLEVLGCEVVNVSYRGIYAAAGGTGHSFISNTVRNINARFLDSMGIFFYGAEGEARNNDVEDCSVGIGFQAGAGGTASQNSIRACDLGILTNGATIPVTIEANDVADSEQGIQSIAPSSTININSNTINGCDTGLTFFGLGTGSNHADGNDIDGQGVIDTQAVFITTDVSPWGFADVTVDLTRNQFRDTDLGVVLWENSGDNTPLLNCTLSSDASLYNTFTGSGSFNVYLEDCNDAVDATHNFWGAVSPALIEETLWHQVDDAALGLIDFSSTVNLYITVDDDGPADYTTINPAVQALLPGGTILVMPGLYVEDVVIDRSCIVQGSGTDANPAVGTVLQGASISPDLTPVLVTGSDVFIHDLRVDGRQLVYDQARRAVYASGVSGLTVTDCVIHTTTTGIAYSSSTDGTFLRNEVYDFGINLNYGGGIFIWAATAVVGTPTEGNHVHDGVATGIIFHNSSNGAARGNVVEDCALGYLSNGASAVTVFEMNEARGCDQGFQGIGNNFPVEYTENSTFECDTGFTLFGLGAQVHTYTDNYIRNRTLAPDSYGLYFTTECAFGDSDLNAVCRGNVISGPAYGIVLDETLSSVTYVMNADFDGSTNPNWITGAGTQEIYLEVCNDDIDASDNYFGSTDAVEMEARITHQVDDPALGLVDFSGLLAPGPDIRWRGAAVAQHEIAIVTTGEPGEATLLLWGLTQANINTQYGTLLIYPFVILTFGTTEDSALGFVEAVVPNPLISGNYLYLQGVVGNGPARRLTTGTATVTVP